MLTATCRNDGSSESLDAYDGVADPSYRYDADGNLTCEYTGPNCSHGAITKETDAYWSFNMTHTIGDGATSLRCLL
jgi:hypothetical protein